MLREFGAYTWDMVKVVAKLMVIVLCANRFTDAIVNNFWYGFLWILPIGLILTYTAHYARKRGYEAGHMEGHHKGYQLAKESLGRDTRRGF